MPTRVVLKKSRPWLDDAEAHAVSMTLETNAAQPGPQRYWNSRPELRDEVMQWAWKNMTVGRAYVAEISDGKPRWVGHIVTKPRKIDHVIKEAVDAGLCDMFEKFKAMGINPVLAVKVMGASRSCMTLKDATDLIVRVCNKYECPEVRIYQ